MSLLNPEDLQITEWPPAPPVGIMRPVATASGVRILHTPTKLEATSTVARSQHRNRDIALAMLEAGLLEYQRTGS